MVQQQTTTSGAKSGRKWVLCLKGRQIEGGKIIPNLHFQGIIRDRWISDLFHSNTEAELRKHGEPAGDKDATSSGLLLSRSHSVGVFLLD